MQTVDVIAHCFNYSRLLTLHLSALALRPPENTHVTSIICFTPSDTDTVAVLDYFRALSIRNVTIKPYPMVPERLFRRAIGRNELGKATQADFVFYSDVDYLLDGPTVDTAVAKMMAHGGKCLYYPQYPMQSISHEHGDSEIAKVTALGIYDIDRTKYEPMKLPCAIGGAQWISGNVTRQKGYLPDGHKFLEPEPVWRQTVCDTRARGWWGLPQHPMKIDGVYRIRHSIRGREQTGCKL